MDLISRQAAIDALGDMPMSWADTDAEIQAQEDWKQHREALLKLPTAEKRGKWMQDWRDERGYTHISGYKCTECDALYPWKTNYCPNCGARMEESDGNSD